MYVLNIRKLIIVFAVLLLALVPLIYKMAPVKNENNGVPPKPEMDRKDSSSPYGEFLSWEEVNKIFPKYSKATVIGFETGLKFRVQKGRENITPMSSR